MNPETTSVTGVLVTGKHVERYPLARQAVKAWTDQNYPGPKELLIINDHPTQALFPEGTPDTVREIRIPDRASSLGSLRNMGIDLSRKYFNYLVQWDDDDFSHPGRLKYQVENTENGHASMFKWEINCNLLTGDAFANNGKQIRGGGFPGTMMWPRAIKARFPDKGKAEDTEFILAMKKEIRVDVLPNEPFMYTRFYHGHNTWSEKHVMKRKQGARSLSPRSEAWINHLLHDKYKKIMEVLRASAG